MTSPGPSVTDPAPAAPRSETPTGRPSLVERVPEGGTQDPDEILDRFLGWVTDVGFDLYPAQEEALLELVAGRHVILNTPTGSGKSLVALGLHFKGLCEGRRSFYTSPIKALASEKFFSLCQDFGPENVAMLTGDAAINPRAPIRCCTAEVLSNMSLRQGEDVNAPYVIMDEFHYYSDPDRGVAWQIPLLTLPHTRFLLMSATLGNTRKIEEYLRRRSGAEVAVVSSDERPVPLDYEYRETPLHQSVQELFESGKAPIYIVNFTQRECAELAQSLTSLKLLDRDEKRRIAEAVEKARLDTPYGKEMRRFLRFGIGVHHAGLLPKYRLLVEQLSQQGWLKVICGTDTLGVGVNIPIRTVLFTKLCKFDGEKVAILSVRDFKQIAGRAGRKGFDERGSVVCQAPEHVVENLKMERRATQGAKSSRKKVKKKPPERGFVPWNQDTFQRLIARPPETLRSRFKITQGTVLNLLQHDAEIDDPEHDNFSSLRALIRLCHEADVVKRRLLRDAAMQVRSLGRAGIVRMVRDTDTPYFWVTLNEDLQFDFSLHHSLSLYMVKALDLLDASRESYPLDVLSLVESILENPDVVLRRQVDKIKDELVARLKEARVPYEERMEKLQEVTHPKPNAEFIYSTFNDFRRDHPWVGGETIRPKSIGREIYEDYLSFHDYIRSYGLQRSEGVLLRYLSQLYKVLVQSVPEAHKTDDIYDLVGFFRTLLERIDTSLLDEWESLLHPELRLKQAEERQATHEALRAYELLHDPRVFTARVRAEMHQLVRALANGNFEEAQSSVRPNPDDPEGPWDAERFEAALAPFLEEHGHLVFNGYARQAHFTRLRSTGPRTWEVSQVLVDPEEENLWCVEGSIDLTQGKSLDGPLVIVRRLGP